MAETAFSPRSDLVRLLVERGHVYQATDLAGLDEAAADRPLTGYIGFDATAASLHVGSLVQIMTLRRLQKTGHRPIVLMGGATTKVGDPSDKSAQRPMLGEADIAANIAGIRRAFEPFLSFGDKPSDALMVNNADWLEPLGYIEFLRDYGVHFTVNKMLTLDFVRSRIASELPLTVLEFNYMLMQAADFLELYRRVGCTVQFGGSEQWGNIVNGADLIRRVEGARAFGVTAPLMTTASGVKMGKTAAGAVWLNAELLGPYEYWQYWRNAEDADVGRFLRMFTELPLAEIGRLEALGGAEVNEAKKVLANEATALMHGPGAAEAAAGAARAAFEEGRTSVDLPTLVVDRARLETGAPLATLATEAGLASSRSEARRLAQGGGLRLNDEPVLDGQRLVGLADLGRDGLIKLAAGKKKIVLIRAVEREPSPS